MRTSNLCQGAQSISPCAICVPIIPVKSNPYNASNFKTTARSICQAAFICGILPEADLREDTGVFCWGYFPLCSQLFLKEVGLTQSVPIKSLTSLLAKLSRLLPRVRILIRLKYKEMEGLSYLKYKTSSFGQF